MTLFVCVVVPMHPKDTKGLILPQSIVERCKHPTHIDNFSHKLPQYTRILSRRKACSYRPVHQADKQDNNLAAATIGS